MEMMTQKKLVPALRFSKYLNNYHMENILDICTMKARIGWQNLRKEEHLPEGDYYLVTGTDFVLNKIDWDSAKFVLYERYIQDKKIPSFSVNRSRKG